METGLSDAGASFRALRLSVADMRAELARVSLFAMGRTAPNPAVGCVILTRAAGETWRLASSGGTEIAGGRHAEIVALDALPLAGDPLRLYVTLEPCSHYGRTPPCTERLLRTPELKVVALGALDPTLPDSGAARLRSGGVRVRRLASARFDPAAAFLAGFLMRAARRGPRLHLKLASDAQGVCGATRERLLLSDAPALAFGQLLRRVVDAVLVGPGTVAVDRPSLAYRAPDAAALARLRASAAPRAGGDLLFDAMLQHAPELGCESAEHQPERLFLLGRDFPEAGEFLLAQARLQATTGRAPIYLCSGEHRRVWENRAPLTAILPGLRSPEFPRALREWLAGRGLNEVLVEGGPGLLNALRPALEPEDRLLLLRNASARTAPATAGALAPVPEWFFAAPPCATYQLDQDQLELRYADFLADRSH